MQHDLMTQPRVAMLVAGLESAGWRILAMELDMTRQTARIEVRRGDGLHVTFDARNGRASLTREVMEMESVRVGRRGDVARAERVRPRFIGRSSGMGLREGLRTLCNYLADNARIALPRGDVRNLFGPLMDGNAHSFTTD